LAKEAMALGVMFHAQRSTRFSEPERDGAATLNYSVLGAR
jgi:hypothetical protein